jgi:hypothetical protein
LALFRFLLSSALRRLKCLFELAKSVLHPVAMRPH